MSHLISVNNLHKSYGEAIAIRGISFDVEVSEDSWLELFKGGKARKRS